jgi:hypothetical protein
MLYVVIGHRLANVPSERRSAALDRLSLVAAIGAVAPGRIDPIKRSS